MERAGIALPRDVRGWPAKVPSRLWFSHRFDDPKARATSDHRKSARWQRGSLQWAAMDHMCSAVWPSAKHQAVIRAV